MLIPARMLAPVAFPGRARMGVFAMLAAYFDDSGTHDSSQFVVWAGVIGTVEEFDRLESAWRTKLAAPLPGKRSLSKFSTSDCARGRNEFAGYEQGARDALRYDMREIIGMSGVRPCSYAVPVSLYDRIIRGRVRKAYGPPDGMAFAACADAALKVSKANNMPLACVFDKGQKRPWLDFLLEDADRRAAMQSVPISYSYASVVSSAGLQAADVIATEHYWYSLEAAKSSPPSLTPHFKSFVGQVNPTGYWLMEPDIMRIRDEYLAAFPLKDWLRSLGARKSLPKPNGPSTNSTG